METAAPTKFGKYDVVGVLGKGAMGIVYDCRDPVIGRRVAIKTVLKESLDSSEAEGLLGRFKQEAQAAGRLNHPGVVSIYDYGETADVAFIAMEYISGKELKSYFDKGEKFALADTVRIMSAILEALEHAHVSKVVHRDIKPANIMITEDGRVKVADFGVAKIESSLATQIGTRVGTPAYMAPEQHRMMAVDGRADLFSCGVILYQFLTHGARPFTGGSQTIARNILTQTPTPPSQINVELLPAWDLLVKKALAKRADERYQTAREFIDALRRAVGDLPAASAVQPSGIDGASTGGSRPPAEPAALSRAATTTNSGSRPERTDLAMESELEFWKEIKDSDHPDDFAAFIDSFPDGRFSHLAKRRLDKLKRASGSTPAGEDQTELSAGHTAVKSAPGAATQSGAGAPANQALVPPDGGAEQESAERARQDAEQQAQQEIEARQREAEARQREEAAQQARRAAAELAERETRARAQQEAEERTQQAQKREEARIAAEQAQLQQQEQAKRDAEAKRQLELEAQKRNEAEEKVLKAAQERKTAEEQRQRERDAVAKREAEAKAGREAQEQERQKKETAAKAAKEAKEAQTAKELAERKQRETEKAARDAGERARKEAQAKQAAADLATANKAAADRARAEREAAEKAQRGAAIQAEADATVIRQLAPNATATRPVDKAAVKEVAAQQPFDPDATAIRPADAYATLIRPGAAAADLEVDIDLTENAPAHYLKEVRTAPVDALQPLAPTALKSPGAPVVMPAATPAKSTGADAIRLPQTVAQGAASGRAAVSASLRTAEDEDEAQAHLETKKKPVFLVAGVAAALVAAGVGWFQFTSTPAPPGKVSAQAGVEGEPAKDQAAKAVADGVSGKTAPTPATAEAQKSRDAAAQKKAEQEAQSRAVEKTAADKVAADKAAEDKLTTEKLASAKSASERAAITKLAADKTAADKLAAEKGTAAKSATDKAAADKLAADKAVADKLASDKAASDKVAADKVAADKAAADRLAVEKAAADKVAADKAAADRVAAAGSIADRIAAATSPPELYKRAVVLRGEGKTSQAVPLLRQASSQGHGPSSRLLAVIYKDGAPDVRSDFRQAERFQALGESQGDR